MNIIVWLVMTKLLKRKIFLKDVHGVNLSRDFLTPSSSFFKVAPKFYGRNQKMNGTYGRTKGSRRLAVSKKYLRKHGVSKKRKIELSAKCSKVNRPFLSRCSCIATRKIWFQEKEEEAFRELKKMEVACSSHISNAEKMWMCVSW